MRKTLKYIQSTEFKDDIVAVLVAILIISIFTLFAVEIIDTNIISCETIGCKH